MRVAVLASGTGSILEAILDAGIEVALVLVDRRPEDDPKCKALEIAKAHGVPGEVVNRRDFGFPAKGWERKDFTREVTSVLQSYHIDLVVMAGWMTMHAEPIFEVYPSQVLNTHPSLLPKYKGDTAVADALASGDTETGCTIHVAELELDSERRILAQVKVPILPGDTEEILHERIKEVERWLYVRVIRDIMEGKITL